MNTAQAYEAGTDRGETVASWMDTPEKGSRIDDCIDWQGLGDYVTLENWSEYMEMLCTDAESNGRQFSPFEITARDLNSSDDADELWESFDEGIHNGICTEIAKRSLC